MCQIATGSYVGNGLNTEGTKISIVVPFTPKMIIVFPYTSFPWKSPGSTSTLTGAALLSAVSNSATTISGSAYQFFIWYDALSYTALVSVRSSSYRYGSQANFSLVDNVVSWTLAKPSNAQEYEAPSGTMIANSSGNTYHWLAIG